MTGQRRAARRDPARPERDGTTPAESPASGTERSYREIRSARFPQGLPDRSDSTVLEAFDAGWLLIEHSPGTAELVGMAEDYEEARAWLTERIEPDED